MTHRIFISHKSEDKPIVEPVALRLRQIFGEDAIFYDAWSIQPGDGIIDKINEGLKAPEFVFFFVSKLSLASGVVKLEWQNALFKATKGETKLIPVRIDNVVMPDVLKQSLYIDIYSVGIEAGINQIVNVVQGNSSFTPQHEGFSNLTANVSNGSDGSLIILIKASHLMEPNPKFVLLFENVEADARLEIDGSSAMLAGFYEAPFGLEFGNGFTVAPMGGAITPERPMKITVHQTETKAALVFKGLLHGWSPPFRAVPVLP